MPVEIVKKSKKGNDKNKNSKNDDSPSGALPFLSKKQFEMLKQYMGKSTKPQTLKKGGKAKKMMAKGGTAGGKKKMMGGGKAKKMMRGGGKTKKYMSRGGKAR